MANDQTPVETKLDAKEYEIEFLKLLNKQLRHRIEVLERQLADANKVPPEALV